MIITKNYIEYYIENDADREDQRGIGGGIDYCVSVSRQSLSIYYIQIFG